MVAPENGRRHQRSDHRDAGVAGDNLKGISRLSGVSDTKF